MSKRSLWKGPFIDEFFFQESGQTNKKIKTTSRDSVILPFLIGRTFQVYNGKFYITLTFNEEMVGHKIGEFVPTRLRHIYKIKKKAK